MNVETKTMISDLPQDLVEEILSRVPITSLRAMISTCKRWNGLSKDPSFTRKHSAKAKEFMVIMMNGLNVSLMSVNLHNHNDLVEASIKRIHLGDSNQVEISKVFHCDGLLLCLINEENTRLVVWNPYLGQRKWIEPRTTYEISDVYGIGYDSNNNHHKILRFFLDFDGDVNQEIYDFKFNARRNLTTSLTIVWYKQGVSLKGNAYFFIIVEEEEEDDVVLICFDFTRERFGPSIHLPFHHPYADCEDDLAVLSSVREEQLAVLYRRKETSKLEIWITNKIESNVVSWNKILAFDTNTIIEVEACGIFFVSEEKKKAVICGIDAYEPTKDTWLYKSACIIGEDGYFNKVDLGKDLNHEESLYLSVYSYYVPSLVQINQPSSDGRRLLLGLFYKILFVLSFSFLFLFYYVL